MKTTKHILIMAAAAVVAVSCQKNELQDGDGIVRYAVDFGTPGTPTKGTLVNTTGDDNTLLSEFADIVGSFDVKAYNGSSEALNQTVTWSGGAWTATPTAYWPQQTSLSFLAYGNLPTSGSSVEITSAGQTLTHAMVSAVADQKDILLGYYRGRGVNGNTAKIRFQHPLTAVFFKKGDIGDEVITSITLSDLAASGTVTMDADGIIGAWSVDAYTAESSQSNSEGLTVDGTSNAIGNPFILIPQTLATNNVKLTVACKSGLTLETTLASGEWKSQKTNWYTLNYGTSTNWTLEVTPWGAGVNGGISAKDADCEFEVSEESHTFRNTTAQDVTTIDVTSEISVDGELMGNLEWTIKSYQIGTSAPVTVGGSTFKAGGLTAETTAEGNLRLTAAARTSFIKSGSHDYWTNNGGISGDTDGSGWSPADWTSATASSPIDLSMFDPYTDTQNAYGMTTANCYVIRHAGTYKLPLVYGNGVVEGTENKQSYYPNVNNDITDGETRTEGSDGNYRLVNFKNHLDNDIASAFIENNTGCTASSAAIVWQDKAEVISDVQIVAGASTGTPGSYTTSNVRYLQFTVDNSTVCQNNAIIAVKDGSGNIMWSWHIWTTNNPAILSGPIQVTNYTGVEYDFFPLYNLGWIEPDHYLSLPDVRIILQQDKSGNEIAITVSQPESTIAGRGCYYQFGRKDPMCTVDSPNKGTFTPNGGNNGGAGVSLATAICNPNVFYTVINGSGPDANYDWCDNTYYNLWTGKKSTVGQFDQNADIIKTVYDPSPVGYKLPASNAFTGFTTTNVDGVFDKGWNFFTKPDKEGATVFFPVAGCCSYINGTVINDSHHGNYWSAVPNSLTYGYHLYFSSGSVTPLHGSPRTNGFLVRPVLESAPAVASTHAGLQAYEGSSL